ncbi:MAG: DUF6345 domain-containing protein [Deltaproteobacteria bacterium]|nr:DUF6345 domain-containing protein [Deltaproteobacteria bacterium]
MVLARLKALAKVVSLAALLSPIGCGDQPRQTPGQPGETAALALALTLPDGSDIANVQYNIVGGLLPSPISNTIPVPQSNSKITALVSVPAGSNYLLALFARSNTGTTCEAEANFNIVAGQTTNVGVVLACHEGPRNGTLVINGQLDQCPVISSLSAQPISAAVGENVFLNSTASDADGDALTYAWTAIGGTLANPSAADTTFTCTSAGMAQVALTVSDGRPACNKRESFAIDCVSGGVAITAPSFAVLSSGVTAAEAALLKAAFNLPDLAVDQNGVARFADENTFLAVPTQPFAQLPTNDPPNEEGQPPLYEAFNFEEIKKIQVIEPRAAEQLAARALLSSDLLPAGAFPVSQHTRFEAVSKDGVVLTSQPIDTSVSYGFLLGNYSLEGPGAKIRVAYDGSGKVTQFIFSSRKLAPGPEVAVLNNADAAKRCLAWTTQPGTGEGRVAKASLAYFAPPLSEKVQQIEPSFRCEIRERNGAVGQVYFVPASVSARPPVFNLPQDPRLGGPSMMPTPAAARPVATRAFDLAKDQPNRSLLFSQATTPSPSLSVSRIDVGSEGTGVCSGLPNTVANVQGFNARMGLAGVPTQFTWFDNNAWEDDWKDPSKGGNDSTWVDDVDMTYWQGHGWPDGFSFSGCSSNDDSSLTYNDAVWGNKDAEWMSLFTCLVLNTGTPGNYWYQRWGRAFHGLHQINSFETVSYHSSQHGQIYAGYLTGVPWFWWINPMKVRVAWAQASIDDQPASVIWATMGPISNGSWMNFNDHFWGKGAVGPDIPANQIAGYWRIFGGS